VRHQLAHRHLAAGRLGRGRAVRIGAGEHLELGELRDVPRHRILEAPLSFLVEHHHRCAGDWLGHRVDPEDRVLLNRIALADILHSDGVVMHDLAVARQQRDDAGGPFFVDRPLHRFVDAAQPLGRDANRFGRRDGEIADPGCRGDGAQLGQARQGSNRKDARQQDPDDPLLRVFESSWLHRFCPRRT
jgi:hypothetical protein